MEKNGYTRTWWKEAVVYQVYPRSFYDSNGDGIGDLRGLVEKLDHIKGLGVDVIWLSPHFDSPNADNGYDIRDYRMVGAEFGTMQDFDDLLSAIHAAGMKLIIDLVVNHTSDEHAWFVESRASRDNPKRDWYIWRDRPANNWTSIFGGPAWTCDEATGDYYLHLFDPKQPDLNWDNPEVRAGVYDIMRFWLDKGVDGFRMDVIPFISKDQSFPDLKPEQQAKPQYVYTQGTHVHEYLHEMRTDVLDHYDTMTVGEAFGVTPDQTPDFIDERRGELDLVFQFAAVEVDRGPDGRWVPWTLPDLKAAFARQNAMDKHCWPAIFLGNHDNPRIVSRYGDDRPEWREKSAMVLATLLLTQKGTPFLYQGDEIGLTNRAFSDISQFNDLWTKNAWQTEVVESGGSPEAFFANQNHVSRDHARMPIPWTTEGGFTTGKPWFALNPTFAEINAGRGKDDPLYLCYAFLIAAHHAEPALTYGDYTDLLPEHPHLFAYTRTLEHEGNFIVLNFSPDEQAFERPTRFRRCEILLCNYKHVDGFDYRSPMRGWEARIYRLS